MWESRRLFGEISKGLVERVGSRFLAFHSFHRPGISTALFFAAERQTGADPGQVPGKGGCCTINRGLAIDCGAS
jgi:hypothetical protein